jgi:hypothetical protein
VASRGGVKSSLKFSKRSRSMISGADSTECVRIFSIVTLTTADTPKVSPEPFPGVLPQEPLHNFRSVAPSNPGVKEQGYYSQELIEQGREKRRRRANMRNCVIPRVSYTCSIPCSTLTQNSGLRGAGGTEAVNSGTRSSSSC